MILARALVSWFSRRQLLCELTTPTRSLPSWSHIVQLSSSRRPFARMDQDGGDLRPWVLSTVRPHFQSQSVILDRAFQVVVWKDFVESPETYQNKIQGILYIPTIKPEMTEELLRKLPNLRVVTTHSTGTNHLNLALLRGLGLKVGHARGILDDTCADFAFGLLLAMARRLPECMASAQGHEGTEAGWSKTNPPIGVKVSGATIGILGMGCIGYEVARRASGFKMKVLYHNRKQRTPEEEAEVKATYCRSLEEMLPVVDYLVITASLNQDSKHIVGRKQIHLMKSSAILVNAARGQIIDQEALVEALRSGSIRGAALDATWPEPLPKDHPLLHMPNAIVTAHLSSFVEETMDKVMQNCVDNLMAGIEGRQLPTEVDPRF